MVYSCLFAICLSSLVRYLDTLRTKYFLLLSFKMFFCILHKGPLSDVCFLDTLSQSMACLSIPLKLSFTAYKFLFKKNPINQVFLLWKYFRYLSKNESPNLRSRELFLYLLVVHFSILLFANFKHHN